MIYVYISKINIFPTFSVIRIHMENRYQNLLNAITKMHDSDSPEKPNDKILIIDGTNTFIRVFSSMPTTNDDGVHVAGIVGFLRSIGAAIKLVKPTRLIVVFDGQGGSIRRKKLFPDYKLTRSNRTRPLNRYSMVSVTDETKAMLIQSIRCVEYLSTLPITLISEDYVEADDVMAYLTTNVFKDSEIIIMSTDKDFLQLIDERVKVWSPTKKKFYTVDSFYEEFGIHTKNYLLYKILDGDKSDNIPGVNGIGFKTIEKRLPFLLSEQLCTIEDVLKISLAKKDEAKIYERILESKEQLFLNEKLMQLQNVDISGKIKLNILKECRANIQTLNKSDFHLMFLEDRLTSIFPDINSWISQNFYKLDTFAKEHNSG